MQKHLLLEDKTLAEYSILEEAECLQCLEANLPSLKLKTCLEEQ
jgi:hypothetical protein